jgi:electron transport complex protein RnfC
MSTTKATLSQDSTATNEADHTEHLTEKNEQSEQQTLVKNNTDVDRKAKIAAAVAKAKAKKMAIKSQQASIKPSEKVLSETDSNNKQEAENKRARVAAAVAKAKAKKLAASSDKSSTSE